MDLYELHKLRNGGAETFKSVSFENSVNSSVGYVEQPFRKQLTNHCETNKNTNKNAYIPSLIQIKNIQNSDIAIFHQRIHVEKSMDEAFRTAKKQVVSFLNENDVDYSVPNNTSFYCHKFHEKEAVLFKLEFVTENEGHDLILNCRRLNGSAFVLKVIFDELVKFANFQAEEEIVEDSIFQNELKVDDEPDYGDFFDEDETEESDLLQEEFKFLNLNTSFVESWMRELPLLNSSEVSTRLGVLAFNTFQDANLKLMLKSSHVIITALMSIMKREPATLSEIYACTYFLTRLQTGGPLPLTAENIRTIASCLVRWSNVNQKKINYSCPVPVSNSIQRQCGKLLQRIAKNHHKAMQSIRDYLLKQLKPVVQHKSTIDDVTSVLRNVMNQMNQQEISVN